jgi:beta-glucanase (GH16 family)
MFMLKTKIFLFAIAIVCFLIAGCTQNEIEDLQSSTEEGMNLKATVVANSIYTIKNRNSGKVLDVTAGSTSDGAAIIQYYSNGSTNQQWQFISVGSGYYKIKNVNSGKYMDIEGGSTTDGAKNIQWTYSGSTNQQWSLVSAGSGYYKIKNRKSGKILDISGASTADGTQCIQWTDNGTNNQQWFFTLASTRTLLWSEEFNYSGTPNTSIWNFESGFKRNEELQWYQSANASVNGSDLVITAKRETISNPNYVAGSSDWTTNRQYAYYTSSSMTTGGKKSFGKGYYEMRAKIPTAVGTWAAWWSLGNNCLTGGGWPYCGEIDMLEWYWQGTHANVMNQNQVWDGAYTYRDLSFANDYHTWGMIIDDDWIRLYVDGVEVNNTPQSFCWINGYNPFLSQEMYMIVNLAIGGVAGGDPSNTSFPQVYYIDYFRYYSLGY